MGETREAGRELDALVAETVFGARVSWWSLRLVDAPPTDVEWRHGMFSLRGFPAEVNVATPHGDMPSRFMLPADADDPSDWRGIPRYSTDIAAAWVIVEEMQTKGWDADLHRSWDGFVASFDNLSTTHRAPVDPREGGMPLAICRAALAALLSEGTARTAEQEKEQ